MNIAIAGYSGLTGRLLVRLLLEKTDHVLWLIGRSAPDFAEPAERAQYQGRIHSVKTELSNLSSVKLNGQIEAAISCLGTTIKKAGSRENFAAVDKIAVIDFAQLAYDNGATEFHVITAIGSDATSGIFYNRIKGETENALKQMSFGTLTIYRPSLLTGERNESRPGEKIGNALLQIMGPIMAGPFRKYRPVSGEAVAASIMNHIGMAEKGTHIIESDQIAGT